MTTPIRKWIWFAAGSTGVVTLGALAAGVLEMRGLNCFDIRYDRRYFCTEELDTISWLGSAYGVGFALGWWLSAIFLIPVLVAYKTQSPNWAFVAYLLVIAATHIGELSVRSLIRIEDSEVHLQRQNDVSAAFGSMMCGVFLTLIASVIVAESAQLERSYRRAK